MSLSCSLDLSAFLLFPSSPYSQSSPPAQRQTLSRWRSIPHLDVLLKNVYCLVGTDFNKNVDKVLLGISFASFSTPSFLHSIHVTVCISTVLLQTED